MSYVSRQVTEAWVDTDTDAQAEYVLINTAGGFQKGRNLPRDSCVPFKVCDPTDAAWYVEVRNQVGCIDGEGSRDHVEALFQRYTGGPCRDRGGWSTRPTVTIAGDAVGTPL